MQFESFYHRSGIWLSWVIEGYEGRKQHCEACHSREIPATPWLKSSSKRFRGVSFECFSNFETASHSLEQPLYDAHHFHRNDNIPQWTSSNVPLLLSC